MGRILSLVFFPLLPFWSYLLSIRHFKTKFGYLMFILIGTFLDLCIKIRPQDDIYRHFAAYNYSLWSGETTASDFELYYSGSIHLFSSLGLSPIYIYIFWSIVYFTGMYLCVKLLLQYVEKDTFSVMLFICALFFIQVFAVSGVRYFTAAFYFIYFIVTIEKDKKKLVYTLLPCLCPLIHFTFIIPVVGYYLYKIFRPSATLLFVVFLFTWGLSFLDLSEFITKLGFFDDSIYLTAERNMKMINSYRLGRFLYLPLQLSLWFMIIVQFIKRASLDETNQRLLKLALLIMIIFNLFAPSWDATLRFRNVMDWFLAFPILYYYRQNHEKLYPFFVFAAPFCFLLSNWDFLFITGPKVYDFGRFLFSSVPDTWEHFETLLKRMY